MNRRRFLAALAVAAAAPQILRAHEPSSRRYDPIREPFVWDDTQPYGAPFLEIVKVESGGDWITFEEAQRQKNAALSRMLEKARFV